MSSEFTAQKDAIILMLLPHALKSPTVKQGDAVKQRAKKQKVDSEEKKEALKRERKFFILHCEVMSI